MAKLGCWLLLALLACQHGAALREARWRTRGKATLQKEWVAADVANAACPSPVQLKYGVGCRCTESSCGDLPDPHKLLRPKEALILTSQKDGKFLEPQVVSTSPEPQAELGMKLNVEVQQLGQKILGFGGAVSDATAFHYHNLKPALREHFVRRHYGEGGAGYALARVPMNSADFSRMDYTYDNVTDDLALEHFCLRDDTAAEAPCGRDYKADVLKAAQSTMAQAGGDRLKLFVSTWSPPLWYKNQNFACKMKDGLYTCRQSGSERISTSSDAVVEPAACTGNALLEGCAMSFEQNFGNVAQAPGANASAKPIELAGSGGSQEKLTAALLQRAAVKPVKAAKHRRQAAAAAEDSSTDSSLDGALKEKPKFTPQRPDSTGNFFNRGFLSTNSSLQASWALYFSKFIDAYKALGVDVWGVALQNEPSSTLPLWQGMYLTTEMQAEFLVNHLGPTIRRNHPGVKIMVHDDGLIGLQEVVKLLGDSRTAPFVDGVGYHWYLSVQGTYENSSALKPSRMAPNVVSGGAYVRDVQQRLSELGEDKFVLMTEACNGYSLGTRWLGPRLGEWGYGYSYSHDIMWQLRNGAAGWTDWNMMLGQDGGPNLAGNFVDAPTIFESSESFIQNPSFFHLAHYSKYIPPGSRRAELSVACSLEFEHCQAVGFLRPDGMATVVLTNDQITVGPIVDLSGIARAFVKVPKLATGHGQDFNWTIQCGSHTVSGTAPWQSIQTVIMPCS